MLEKLIELIHEQTGDAGIVVTRKSVLLSDLGINSFDLINLICVVEDEFDVEIPDRIIGNFKTVGDVLDYIEEQY